MFENRYKLLSSQISPHVPHFKLGALDKLDDIHHLKEVKCVT